MTQNPHVKTQTPTQTSIFETHILVIGVEYPVIDGYVIEAVGLKGPIAKVEISPACIDMMGGVNPTCYEEAVRELEDKIVKATGKKVIWEGKIELESVAGREGAIKEAIKKLVPLYAKFIPEPRVFHSDGVIKLGKIFFRTELSYEEFENVVVAITEGLFSVLEEPRPSAYDYDYHVGTVKLETTSLGPVVVADVLLIEANRIVDDDLPYVYANEEFELVLQLVGIEEEGDEQ